MDYDEAGAVPGQKKDLLASKKEEDDLGLIGGIQTKSKDVINNMLTQTTSGFSKFLE